MNEQYKELARQAGFWQEHTNIWMCNSKYIKTLVDLVLANEREACAKDADWCIQNHLEHLIPERIRARSTT